MPKSKSEKNNKIHAKEHERKERVKKDSPYLQNQSKGERSMTKEFK